MSEREPALLGVPGGPPGARAPGQEARPGGGVGPGAHPLAGPPHAAAPSRAPLPVNTFLVGGFWRRFAGGAIDLAILLPICFILTWLAGALSGVHLPASRHRGLDFWLDLFLGTDPALIGGLGLSIAIGLIYALVFQVTRQRTVGMRLLKMRVIDLYGDPPTIARCAARTAGYLASLATLGLGFLWIGFDSEKRGLHDWLSGTYVVKEVP
ncbi:MAG TPA: RDD family protein [Kofleriaceae bacterium]|nr:RDD family protein [Kofleriaceae bacterium]